jgi:hypothetical protein
MSYRRTAFVGIRAVAWSISCYSYTYKYQLSHAEPAFSNDGVNLSANVERVQTERFKRFSVTCQNKLIVYKSNTHLELINAVIYQSESLEANKYYLKNGIACRLLHGTKGIGKSTILEEFVKTVCPALYPSIIPIYMSYDVRNQDNLQSTSSNIRKLILQELEKRGILKVQDAEKFVTNVEMNEFIERKLKTHGKYVFLIVDEIDQLYRTHPRDAHYETALQSLSDLAWLGNQKSGRFAVFICGSSASCPLLVTCHADSAEFPRQNGAPYLNSQKFSTWRLPAPNLVEFDNFRPFIRESNDESINIPDSLCRLVAFCVQPTPRFVSKLLDFISSDSRTNLYDFISNSHESSYNTIQLTSFDEIVLNNLNKELRSKNAVVHDMICDPNTGNVDIEKVMKTNWETELKPLKWDEVKAIWETTLVETNRTDKTFRDLYFILLRLCDEGQLSFNQIVNGAPMQIYPARLSQLFGDDMPLEGIHKLMAIAIVSIQKELGKLPAKVLDQGLELGIKGETGGSSN